MFVLAIDASLVLFVWEEIILLVVNVFLGTLDYLGLLTVFVQLTYVKVIQNVEMKRFAQLIEKEFLTAYLLVVV